MTMMIVQRLKKKSIRCLSPSISSIRWHKNSKDYAKNSFERWKMESCRLGGFLPLFPRKNSFLLYRCRVYFRAAFLKLVKLESALTAICFSHLMERYDGTNWDFQLFRSIYGEEVLKLFDCEIAVSVQTELMDCENVTA
ncbi:unnamed protein product [Gongylonema pulchrum]|uniref:Hexaprenyldihydroxybenzoate methyltransferase, mitochondrial-like protein n=1 Tax=Gongylonema pulchrum TaxID=637853 RepID=A0A183F0K5_9BILA|nr:unnamed protein product [Gongylonema pulchrum]